MERVSQRSHQEREKYGDDSGSAIIEDLSDFGHGAEFADQGSDDDDTFEDDDVSFVSAMAAIPPPGPRDHLTWAPGVHGGNDRVQPWNTPAGDNSSLVLALRSLERTLQAHCKLLNRRIKKEKSNSSSTNQSQHAHHQKDQKGRSPVLPKSPTHSHSDKVSSSTLHFHISCAYSVGTQQCRLSIFRTCCVGPEVVVLQS